MIRTRRRYQAKSDIISNCELKSIALNKQYAILNAKYDLNDKRLFY